MQHRTNGNIPFLLLALAGLLSTAGGAQAQNLKPGLWEMSSRMHSGSGEMEKAMADMQKQMASLSPEQRKAMQDMMARQGVGMGSSGPGTMSVRICMTKEMVERNEIAPQDGDCKSTYSQRSGNTMKVSFVCTRPPSNGEGQVTFMGPEAYSTQMTVTSNARGKPEKISMDGQGKWLSAECGAVKPPGAAKK